MERRTTFLQTSILLSVVAAGLLLLANSAYWVHHNVFNTEQFSQTATTAITSETSRRAIAQGVTNQVLEGRPVLRNVAGDTMTNVVSGLLGTEQANRVFSAGISRLHIYLTSNQQSDVTIDLSGIQATLEQLVAVAGGSGERLAQVPSEITIVERDNIPSFYRYGVIFLWLGPLALLGGLALLVYQFAIFPTKRQSLLFIQGLVVSITGLGALLLGPLFKPPLLANIGTTEARVVVGNVYDAFIGTFVAQTFLLIGIGLLMVIGSGVWYGIGRRSH